MATQEQIDQFKTLIEDYLKISSIGDGSISGAAHRFNKSVSASKDETLFPNKLGDEDGKLVLDTRYWGIGFVKQQIEELEKKFGITLSYDDKTALITIDPKNQANIEHSIHKLNNAIRPAQLQAVENCVQIMFHNLKELGCDQDAVLGEHARLSIAEHGKNANLAQQQMEGKPSSKLSYDGRLKSGQVGEITV